MSEYRVYGPPGTGKTTWLVKEATRVAEEVGEDQVSICSLTNTAVREVAGREIPLRAENVTTLHARCKRALNAPAPAESRVAEFIEQYPKFATEGSLPRSLLRQKKAKEDEPETLDEVLMSGSRQVTAYEEVQILRQQLVPPNKWRPDLRRWYGAWSEWTTGIGAPDFTGWLEAARGGDVLPPQQVVFVDEAQDHTPLQLEVIRNWRTQRRVLVGDDDQNLYQWSGAEPDRFFLPPLEDGREMVLSQSYRVPQAVHAVSQGWIRRLRSRREKQYHPAPREGHVRLGDLCWTYPDEIVRRLEAPGSHMFLTSAAYMLAPLLKLLRDEHIPFHNPYRRGNKAWNPLETTRPVIRDYLQPQWVGLTAYSWLRVLRSTGVYQPGKRKQALEWLQAHPREPVYLEDLSQWLLPTTMQKVADEDLSLFKARRPNAPGDWDYAIEVGPQAEPRLIVGTIHSVKGGEADHVYLMPDLSPAAMQDLWDARRADRVVRLMYVGMTRAAYTLELGQAAGPLAVAF